MRLLAKDAKHFAEHPSNHEFGCTHEDLTDDFLYFAHGGVCMAFHPMPWPGVWMVHVMAKPEAWGKTKPMVAACLAEFWAEIKPDHLIAWVPPYRRLAKALIRRMGGKLEGTMANGIEAYGWRPEWA